MKQSFVLSIWLTAAAMLIGCGASAGTKPTTFTAKTAGGDHHQSTQKQDGDKTQLPEPAAYLEQESHPVSAQGARGDGVPNFWIRPGYKVTLAASDLGNARFMCFDSNGTLYLSRPERGDIVMLKESSGKYHVTGTFVSGQSRPHGMCFHNGWLWFTTDGKVNKAKITDGTRPATDVVTVISGLPQGGHWWRSILVTDDGFFTSIGDESNVSDDSGTDREKIWRYSLDGSGKTLWSSGIRNTEKLLYRPGTNDLYGCDQGSDWFGAPVGDKQGNQPITDFYPPDEFNNYVKGGFYGHPFLVGNRIPRYEYQNRPDIIELAAKTIPPAWSFGPHWAADGWTFLDHARQMPSQYDRDAVIALHGSWNRSTYSGYRVELVMFDPVLNIPIGSQMLVGTRGPDVHVLARPVDIAQAPDGSLLFSDDSGNRIYRIQYVGTSK